MFKAMKKKSTVVKKRPVDRTKIGLVTENLFPLYNEEYVINAIKFFNHCPVNKRLELANNINEQAKNLELTIEISEKDPFYKYVNKNIVSTLMTEAFEGSIPTDTITMCCNSDPFVSEVIRKIQNWKLSDLSSLRDLETYIINSADKLRTKNTALIVSGISKLNVFTIINSIMIERYQNFYNKLKYVDNKPISNDLIRFNNLIIKIFDDIFFLLHNHIVSGTIDPLFIKEKLDLVMDMYNTLKCNGFVINRYMYQAIIDIVTLADPDDSIEEAHDKHQDIILIFEKSMVAKVDNDINKLCMVHSFVINTFNMINSSFTDSSKYLETIKGIVSGEVKSILMNFSPLVHTPNDELFFVLKDVMCRNCYEMLDILTAMEGIMKSRNIQYYSKNYTLHLNSIDVLFITEKLKGNYYDMIYTNHCRSGQIIYFGIKKYELFMFGKSDDGYIAIKLYGKEEAQSFNSSYMNFIGEPKGPLKIFKISPTPKSINMNTLTEGIEVSKDGSVKFTFNKNIGYMDEYDKAHKQLEANWKAKNYEGMKQNMAYLFTMVLSIERDYIHNKGKKVDADKKADAIKARMFAINDFKSYMIKLKTAEPGFDFTKYYEENDYDKISFTVSPDTVLGIKKIFQMIMMG